MNYFSYNLKKILYFLYFNVRISYTLHAKKKTPILIYQMGKVGSSTIQKSLMLSKIESPVFHVHALSTKGIEGGEKFKKSEKYGTANMVNV